MEDWIVMAAPDWAEPYGKSFDNIAFHGRLWWVHGVGNCCAQPP